MSKNEKFPRTVRPGLVMKNRLQFYLHKLLTPIDRKIQLLTRFRSAGNSPPVADKFSGPSARKINVFVTCNSTDDLVDVSRVPIDLRLKAPQPGSMVLVFGRAFEFDPPECRLALERLAILPVRQKIRLVAETTEVAEQLRSVTGLSISVQDEAGNEPAESAPPAIQCDEFPKVACIVTALWGGTGSTTIFDSQTEYFLERGYLVCRVFVEHWYKPLLSRKFIAENFEHVQPHLHLVATRMEAADPDQGRSAIGRTLAALAKARLDDPETTQWVSGLADIVVVNHLAHIKFARQHFNAPVVLESHDVMSDLYDLHGVPDFAANGPDDREDRLRDEQAALGLADYCVCFSDADYKAMQAHTRAISIVRPYARTPQASDRAWPETLARNKAPTQLQKLEEFDLLLWGDWHGGNVQSCQWFFDNVYPLLEAHELEIAIAGRLCNSIPKSITRLKGVHALGRVDNLFDFMMRSRIMVIYDTTGSGISVKAMETLAAGRPFASTRAGMRHVDLGTTGYLPSETAADLADDIVKLCQSSAAQQERQHIARCLYDHNFSKERYDVAWDEIVEAVLPAQETAAS